MPRRGPGLPVSESAGADRYPEYNRRQRCPIQAQPPEAPERETPHLDFAGTTPYEDYVQADVLTHLQHLLSDDPGEMVFLVTTQVMELWFTVIVHEWETAAHALREDRVPIAVAALKRSRAGAGGAERLLEAARPAHPRPVQLLPRRPRRGIRLPVGDVPADGVPARRQVRVDARAAPGRAPRARRAGEGAARTRACTTRCLRLLARRGYAVPEPVLDRDLSQKYEPSPEVEAVWAEIYAG